MLKNKNILIGITGGIAAYKICELIRMYKRAEANVKVVCTLNAMNFVTKTTLQSLSQNDVGIEHFNIDDFKPEHIAYTDWADIMVVAPASANTISKIANGIADNLLTSTVCAFRKPIIVVPAMNTGMWENPIIQENVEKLKKLNYTIIDPETGFLACGANGKGRLCDNDLIFDTTDKILNPKLKKKSKIIITAGGTIEDIDPVRYISNYSSGKMGFAIADCAYNQGFEVVLITTKEVEKPYKTIQVKSALDMQKAIDKEFKTANYVVMAAAVADYKIKEKSTKKLKKTSADEITLTLTKNPDILKNLCNKKTKQTIVGFCAESENLEKNALQKIKNKGCDYLVANDISRNDIGFNSDYNEVMIFSKNGNVKKLQKAKKTEIAKSILDTILK